MNIKDYFKKINNKILRINEFVSNPFNHKHIKTPFYITKAKTFVWIENDEKYNY